ncbi:fungal-specific transcription factor domain-containing protein [Plectosphaerella plurivora]|uniref:Fungal-specific transcription factor domain-containing protein n=1 Tax=Plectosphaerella plurivora TaxID=936078 RepID=A0A9P9ABJ0_9PEZI|nr:fungal-specific transcription factor domain-containing protein [Plectosphaerella plurivora]
MSTPRLPSSADSRGGASPSPATRAQACVRCWTRKQKCDRVLPSCSACVDVGVECVDRFQDIDSRLADDDASISHASIASYVASLKRRVAELENGTSQSSQEPPSKRPRTSSYQNQVPVATAAASEPSATIVSINGDGDSEPEEPSGEESAVRDTMGAIGFLSNRAMAEPRLGPRDATPHRLTLTEVVVAALAVTGNDPSMAGPSQPMMVLGDHQVPLTREATISHLRLFLDWAFFTPYLNHNRLLEHFEETVSSHGTPQTNNVPPLHRFNAYLAIATGIMMSPDANRLSFLASSLHALSLKLLPVILRSRKQLEAIHAIAMLLFFSIHSSAGGSSWHLLGLALRTCIALGLHKDAAAQVLVQDDSDLDPVWLFWTLYIMDRSLSSIMDRPFSIQDSDISLPPPSDNDPSPEESDSTRTKRAASRHLLRQAQLLSDTRDHSSTDPMPSYYNLCFWRDSLPSLRDAPITLRLWSDNVDQLACRSLMQIVHPAPQTPMPQAILSSAAELETETIKSCQRLINSLYERSGKGNSSLSSFIDGYDVLSAVVIMACLTHRLGKQDSYHSAGTFESISKASTVVTHLAGRFPALRAFQELLLKISGRMMEEHMGKTQDFFNKLDGLPVIIPRRLRQFIRNEFP